MVQQGNGLMLSPAAQFMAEEHFVTVIEEDGVEATESVPDRVLTEITIPVSNTQSTPINDKKVPIDNTLRASTNDHTDFVGQIPINGDADSSLGGSDSNKEN